MPNRPRYSFKNLPIIATITLTECGVVGRLREYDVCVTGSAFVLKVIRILIISFNLCTLLMGKRGPVCFLDMEGLMINMQKLAVGGLMAASLFLAGPSLAIEAESLSTEETAWAPECTVTPPRDFADVKLRSGAVSTSTQSVAANPINGNVFLAAYAVGGSCWVRTSTNAGKTWGVAKKLPMAGKPNCDEAVVTWAPDGSRVYAAYTYRIPEQGDKETGALVSSSTDRGLTWSTPRIAAKYGPYDYLSSPQLSTPLTAGDARWVYLLVRHSEGGSTADFDFVRSGDRGQTWSAPYFLWGYDSWNGAMSPSIAGGRRGEVLVAWSWFDCLDFDHPCKNAIDVERSSNHGAAFQQTITAVPDTYGESSVAFGAGGMAHLVYSDYRGIYYVYSTKAPYTTWSAPVRLNDDLSASLYYPPALAVSACGSGASVLHAVWLDDRAGSETYKVYYTRKVAKTGERWSANLPVSAVSRYNYSLAAGRGTAVGIWVDWGSVVWASRIAPGVSCP